MDRPRPRHNLEVASDRSAVIRQRSELGIFVTSLVQLASDARFEFDWLFSSSGGERATFSLAHRFVFERTDLNVSLTMVICVAYGCLTSNDKHRPNARADDVSFHRFPREEELVQRWVEALRPAVLPDNFRKCGRVCSDHFKPEDYRRDLQAELMNLKRRKQLLPDAVPSVFVVKHPPQPVVEKKQVNRGRKTGPTQLRRSQIRTEAGAAVAILRFATSASSPQPPPAAKRRLVSKPKKHSDKQTQRKLVSCGV